MRLCRWILLSIVGLFFLLPLGIGRGEPLAHGKDFALLAVQHRGRKKPFPTFAYEMALEICGKPRMALQEGTVDFLDLTLGLWLVPERWKDRPVILVESAQLRKILGLNPQERYVAFSSLSQNPQLRKLVPALLGPAQGSVESLAGVPKRELEALWKRLETYEALQSGRSVAIIPDPRSPRGSWVPLEEAIRYYPSERLQALLASYQMLRSGFLAGDQRQVEEGGKQLARECLGLAPDFYPDKEVLVFEYEYMHLDPWRWAAVAYGAAAVTLLLTARWKEQVGYRVGYLLVQIGLLSQLYGFVARVILAGRPPVANMYESILWVTFGVVLLALLLDAFYHSRYVLLGALPFSCVGLFVADTQPALFDPTIQPLVPVLRNNFWLIAHVLTITLGYAAFALAMGLGHIYLWRFIRRRLPGTEDPMLQTYIYRTLQIGVLLLATGTVMGAVWANYSWGRFWDWDPKETWALITLLCYLVVLHGRLLGWWSGFGLAIGSLVGFLCVLMAWYGVNFVLGKGLHSYGFGSGGLPYALAFGVVELSLAGFALYRRLAASNTGSAIPASGALSRPATKG
ncbi:cytochrome c biogenesis protein [Candidatus Methylacidithermus pantelleriae]|uniref:ABC-type transport system involved in cytochrome c biogenesis, permease component n=1 Tax=Candidatus Methylacidithermus pantelleriae TaxID=2744239 RepID=A0A8J2BLQ9_9BACT|nr:cytochrome c biogenesis protein CcsA [Candidatus Methylacidithermus pantelleriae]CAF0689474.1 ABC-type transport system involved in cytochrome c biogenesis, permease component [Candidatus Methylacidithermus pantelleriae]